MLGTLTETQIDQLVASQFTGRLGCSAGGKTYVVPIHYFFKDGVIYAHSAAGMKIDMMRQNPQVCLQVDDVRNIFRWRSAILWGTFEEITDPQIKHQAMQGILHRLMPLVTTPSGHPSHGIVAESQMIHDIDLTVYRIVITEKTGRFEEISDN